VKRRNEGGSLSGVKGQLFGLKTIKAAGVTGNSICLWQQGNGLYLLTLNGFSVKEKECLIDIANIEKAEKIAKKILSQFE
jgi:hypothetical protein